MSNQTTYSNLVRTRVLAFYEIQLTPPGTVASPAYVLAGAPGDTLYCTFAIDNLGNAHDSVTVASQVVPPSTAPVNTVILFRDVNGNGVFDAGEDNPSFLGLDAGTGTPLDVAVVLPAVPPGDTYIDVQAVSVGDTTGTVHSSVFRVINTGLGATALHLGPSGNARALPGGEGSGDDRTQRSVGYGATTFTFDNDVLNESSSDDFIRLSLPDTLSLPAGVTVSIQDTAGVVLPSAPIGVNAFTLGTVPAGATKGIRIVLNSTVGPLSTVLPGPLNLELSAVSAFDTTRANATLDRLTLPAAVAPNAALSIKQTFKQKAASAGDVVTLVVTVTNITDSLTVDNTLVSEHIAPQLNFTGSPDFVLQSGTLKWNAGSLDAGESRNAVIKLVANSRVSNSWATATGRVVGVATTGDDVYAGPAVSTIKIENDVFATEGVILGDVFVDTNGNGRRDDGERGVRNAAVYIESGEYVVTDSLGVFSLPRVFPGYRTVRLDEASLPPSVRFSEPVGGWSGAGRPNERLMHLLPGGNARVAFALQDEPPPVHDVTHTVSAQEHLSVRRIVKPYKALTLPSSQFVFGKPQLIPGADVELQPVAEFLHNHPDWSVFLEGHTDSIPMHSARFPDNYALSVARAESIRDMLVMLGVSQHSVFIRGYGDTRPIATNTTIRGRSLNRRVDVSFVPPGIDIDPQEPGVDQKTVRDLSELPDSLQVSMTWELSTSSEDNSNVVLRADVPDAFADVTTQVRAHGHDVEPDADAFRVGGFKRSESVTCRVRFTCAETDTALIRDMALRLTIGGRETVVRPSSSGAAGTEARMFDVLSWTEQVEGSFGGKPAGFSEPDSARAHMPKKDLEILEPVNRRTFAGRDAIVVHTRLPLGNRFTLSVNGVLVDKERIGQRSVDVVGGEELVTWYGVRIQPGWNQIRVTAVGVDGITRSDSVTVALASAPKVMGATRESYKIPADGHTKQSVRFFLQDGLFLPVMDGYVATVTEGAELLANVDARPDEHGLQVLSTDGFLILETVPANETGHYTIRLRMDALEAEVGVVFVEPDRPLLATGIVDMKVGTYLNHGTGDATGVENFVDGFDSDGEARLFVRGTAFRDVNVTARLDTRKRVDDPLFKDVSPDKQYPIFGDGSSLHNAAPSQGGNYVSLERGEAFVRYGDFRTPLDQGEFLTYQRAATGVTSSLARGASSFNTFVTRTDLATHKDEIPADGTSGFYYLSQKPVVENSERIFLETRDRYQSEKVTHLEPMIRNKDYTINNFDGSILFKYAVAAFDRELNPVYIVVTYETETNEKSKYLYGMRGQLAESSRYRVGTTAVANTGDGGNWTLYGADGKYTSGRFSGEGEIARSEDENAGHGNAYKLRGGYSDDKAELGVYLRRVDGGFNNPSFRGSNQELSSIKSGFEGRLHATPFVSFDTEGYVHQLHRTDERRENVRAAMNLEHKLFRFVAGARLATHRRVDETHKGSIAILGAGVGGETRPGITTRWEKNLGNDFVDDYPDRLKTNATLPLGNRLKVSATHEYMTAAGRAASHQFVAGVEGRVTGSMRAYSKYSMDQAAGDARMGAVSGIVQDFRLTETMTATAGLEAFQSLAGREDEEYFAFKSGLNVKVPGKHFVESQYENHVQSARSKHMIRLNAAQQLEHGVSWLMKNALGYTDRQVEDNALSYQGVVAGAYRPAGRAMQGLLMMRNYYERFTPIDPEAITWRLVMSGDVNYLPSIQHELRLKYAFKHVEDYSIGASLTTNSDLLLGQYIFRFANVWDVDTWARTLAQRGGGAVQTGGGIEVGRLFFRSIRLGAGYSINGFEDPDISGTDAWSSGFGLRVQLILSDWLLNDFERIK